MLDKALFSATLPLRGRHGQKQCGKTMGQDTHQCKELEAALERPEEMLRLVLEAIPVAVHWKDLHSVYLGCNSRFVQDAELESPEQILGKTDSDLPWKQYADLYRSRDRQVIQTGQPIFEYEQPAVSGSGRQLWLRQSKLPLRDTRGNIIGVLSTYEDITARKRAQEALQESEARYRAVVEYSPEGIVVTIDDKLVYVNPAALRFAGVATPDTLLGRRLWDFVEERYRAQVLARREAMRQNQQPTELMEGRIRRPDGVVVDAEWRGVPIRYNHQPAVLNCFRDITDRKRAEAAQSRYREELEERVRERTAELVRANERLREGDRLKTQFLATMSHELRTPLNSIIGFTGLLRRGFTGPVNAEQVKQLGLVERSAHHLLALINDLLDLSRIEAGKVEVERAPFEFNHAVTEVLDSLAPAVRQKGLELVVELPAQPVGMTGDRRRCCQVLLNLVNNAIKFTERGRITITARTEGDRLRVCVADTGIGIKPEHLGLLFQAFWQWDDPAQRRCEGSGLGLPLCQRLLGLMGGDIRVESEFGRGSRFCFTLPLHLAAEGKREHEDTQRR